jgi:hypothetical protein
MQENNLYIRNLRQGDTTFHMFVLKMYVQIMSLSVLLGNVCACYVYILKMSNKIKVKKNVYLSMLLIISEA